MDAAKFVVESDEKFSGIFDERHSMGTGVKNELIRKNFCTGPPDSSTPISLGLILKTFFLVA